MIHPLTNTIRPYAWGSRTAIATLLGEPVPSPAPQAELWMGAHPDDPSRIEDGRGLDALIAADRERELGVATAREFGSLPFLLKLLAAGAPLSLQVHPTLAQARAGFAEEDRRGIDRGDPARNYRDANHKPEMICALTPFTGLVGFRPVHATRELIEELDVAELGHVDAVLGACTGSEGVHEAVATLLGLDERKRSTLVAAVGAACVRLAQHHRWAAPAQQIAALARSHPGDAGVIVALLMNLVRLRPGQAVFLPAGVLHAYLEGFGVEALADSDNVLRGGLTPKHIDVPELLDVLDPTPGKPTVLDPECEGAERAYAVPAREFRLSRVDVARSSPVDLRAVRGPQVLCTTAGTVTVEQAGAILDLPPGRSAYLSASDAPIRMSGHGSVHRCRVDLSAPGVP